jgi:hypothetical protein
MVKNTTKPELQVVSVDINTLKQSEFNPRAIDEAEFAQLVKSIKVHSLVQPLIANSNPGRHNVLVAGHQRLLAAKEAGLKTVPVTYLNLTLEQEKALSLRLNRISGTFVDELLRANFDIELLLDSGFTEDDLGHIWDAELAIEDDDDFDEKKSYDSIIYTDIKIGDMFELGRHRLLCGDSTDPDAIEYLTSGLKPTMLYFDPIFNIGLDYDKGVGQNAKYGGRTKDNKSDDEYREMLSKFIGNALEVMPGDAHVFAYCDQNYVGMLQSLMTEHGLTNRRTCIWLKNGFNATPQVAFNKSYEPCVYATRGKPYLSETHNLTEILNRDIATGNRSTDDIIDLFDIWLAKRDAGQSYQHPTQKPLSLHEKALKRCTQVGDVVLDICGGSGSTLLACDQLKRVALLCEIDPVFCQVIINRYEKATGKKAVKV